MGGCSYVGIASTKPVAWPLYEGIQRLQHRGQETAGILTFDGDMIYRDGGAGLVSEVFGRGGDDTVENLDFFKGNWGLSSTRYKTSGTDKSAPPFYVHNPCLVAGAFNGNIINCSELWRELKEVGQYRTGDCDFEVLLKTFGYELSKVMRPSKPLTNTRIYRAASRLMNKIEGSYSAVFLVAKSSRQRLVGIRDPSANRPMVIGKSKEPEGGWIIASEDCLLEDLGYAPFTYPEGGSVHVVKWNLEHSSLNLTNIENHAKEALPNNGMRAIRPVHAKNGTGHCMFEWMYFARPDSYVENRWVQGAREEVGFRLGRREKRTIDMAVPSPDSGRAAAAGFAKGYNTLGRNQILSEDGIYKSTFVGRLFQNPDTRERIASTNMKYSPNGGVIRGKRITFIDDSTVRLTTMKGLIEKMYNKGAKEIHVRIGTPLIYGFCPLGIDMRSKVELAARRSWRKMIEYMDLSRLPGDVLDVKVLAGSTEAAAKELNVDADYLRESFEEGRMRVMEDINEELGTDSLDYCTIPELVDSINEAESLLPGRKPITYNELCTGCLGGRYPVGRETMAELLKNGGSGRAWEQRPHAERAA